MGKLWRRVHFLLHRRGIERELAEEMEMHREMMPPTRRSTFGNATRLLEESSEAWSWTWFRQLCQDLSYGVRVLCGAPAFTLGAATVLALGIGVNLAEFQIFDAMIFHRLTIRDADSVFQLSRDSKQGQRVGFPPAKTIIFKHGLSGIR
jgi:putative ABC transport system permease protein